jgi:hypothetical protein
MDRSGLARILTAARSFLGLAVYAFDFSMMTFGQ